MIKLYIPNFQHVGISYCRLMLEKNKHIVSSHAHTEKVLILNTRAVESELQAILVMEWE